MSLTMSTSTGWLLGSALSVLGVLVLVLLVVSLRLGRRIGRLEERLSHAAPGVVRDRAAPVAPDPGPLNHGLPPQPEFVITQVGETEAVDEPAEPVAAVPASVFADLVLKETVVQTASLFHGLRRALAPETRNRIRFQMRQEVKRSRKQRKAELREVRREWAARQRAAMAEDSAGTTAA